MDEWIALVYVAVDELNADPVPASHFQHQQDDVSSNGSTTNQHSNDNHYVLQQVQDQDQDQDGDGLTSSSLLARHPYNLRGISTLEGIEENSNGRQEIIPALPSIHQHHDVNGNNHNGII